MATVTRQHVFANGETLIANNLNADPANLVAAFANIDNTNIGAAGLYASNLIPTNTATATFGGAVGYTISPGSTTQVPLTLNGATGQAVNLLTLQINGATVSGFDLNGAYFTTQSYTSNAAAGGIFTANATGTAAQFAFNAAGASTGPIAVWQAAGVTKMTLLPTGGLTLAGPLAAVGINVGGALTAATSGAFTGIVTAPYFNANVAGVDGANFRIPNALAGSSQTYFQYNAATTIAGVAASALKITAAGVVDALALDGSGNLGVSGSLKAATTVVAANGSTGGHLIASASGLYSGSGVPAFSAPSGSLYMRYDGAANTRLYVNTSTASTSGTTWSAVTTP